MLIDSHCHVNFNAYKEDGEEVIRRSLAQNIWLINIGSQTSTSKRSIEIAKKYPQGVYAVVGLHPIHLAEDITESATFDGKVYEFVTKRENFDYDNYKTIATSSDKVVGLGEVGLDYYYFEGKTADEIGELKKNQREALVGFLKLADEINLPVVLHCRGSKDDNYTAYDDLYEIVAANLPARRGVVHCFGGNLEQAKKFAALGFKIGFTGIITFKKAEEARQIVAALSLDKILVETDAPFLAPEPYRGKRNEPAYVEFVARKVAEIKGVSFETVAEQTFKNTKELFRLG